MEEKLKLLEKFTEDTERELVDLKYALEFDKQKFTTLLQKYEADLVKVLLYNTRLVGERLRPRFFLRDPTRTSFVSVHTFPDERLIFVSHCDFTVLLFTGYGIR